MYAKGCKAMYRLNLDLNKLKLPSNPKLLLSFEDLLIHFPWMKRKTWDEIPAWYQFSWKYR